MASRNSIQVISEPVAGLAAPLRAALRDWEGVSVSQPVGMNEPSGQRSESGARRAETLLARSQQTL